MKINFQNKFKSSEMLLAMELGHGYQAFKLKSRHRNLILACTDLDYRSQKSFQSTKLRLLLQVCVACLQSATRTIVVKD